MPSLLIIDKITTDGGLQPRDHLNEEVLHEYQEIWDAALNTTTSPFPPVDVIYDGKTHWLVDGYHRLESARRAGRIRIEANVESGDYRKAVLKSCRVNAKHGLRRTNGDKHRQVLRLLEDEEWSTWSDRKIADHCMVDHTTVAKLRKNVTGGIASDTEKPQQNQGVRKYHDKHGNESVMRTDNISKANKTRAKREKAPSIIVLENDPQHQEEEREPPRDELGRAIPLPCLPLFHDFTHSVKHIRQLLIQAREEWNALNESLPISTKGFKGYSSVKGALEKEIPYLISLFQTALPYTVCVYCKGKELNCRACGDSQAITKEAFDRAPEQIRPEHSPTVKELNKKEGIAA